MTHQQSMRERFDDLIEPMSGSIAKNYPATVEILKIFIEKEIQSAVAQREGDIITEIKKKTKYQDSPIPDVFNHECGYNEALNEIITTIKSQGI